MAAFLALAWPFFLLLSLSLSQETEAQSIIELQLLTGGLSLPVAVVDAKNGSPVLFVVELGGFIRVVPNPNPNVTNDPFLDVSASVVCCGEMGLLGLAFHPQYGSASNRYFYINYTTRDENGDLFSVVSRFETQEGNPFRAKEDSEKILLKVQQPFENHNAGDLQFGPDGYLYIPMGDGGSGGDPLNNGQNITSLLGKMLRIDVDRTTGGLNYGIPPDNPFVGGGFPEEIWASGLRNPWRISFDKLTGDLFIADVGQNLYEEVSFQSASSTGGENYGWRKMEASHCFNPATDCNPGGALTLPIIEYEHTGGRCSVTGGYRYRGAIPSLQGLYIYGDFCTGEIFGAQPPPDGSSTLWSSEVLLSTGKLLSSFGEDENGELYITVLSDGGEVYKLVSTLSPSMLPSLVPSRPPTRIPSSSPTEDPSCCAVPRWGDYFGRVGCEYGRSCPCVVCLSTFP